MNVKWWGGEANGVKKDGWMEGMRKGEYAVAVELPLLLWIGGRG